MLLLLAFLTSCLISPAFYLPGVAYQEYKQDEKVAIFVNSLDSSETQLPFDYYHLPFCPSATQQHITENLGQVLRGDNFEASPYEVFMQRVESCKMLCTMTNTDEDVNNFKWMIDRGYKASWVVDGLPAGLRQTVSEGKDGVKYSYYQNGFPIGYLEGAHYYVYNHVHIVLQVHQIQNIEAADTWIVVGVLVNPMSIRPLDGGKPGCSSSNFQAALASSKFYQEQVLSPEEDSKSKQQVLNKVIPMALYERTMYSYSVAFEPSNVMWASRWDMYLYLGKSSEVHWLSIIYSFTMVLFLSGVIAHILGRNLKRDINRYNEGDVSDLIDETGWKQLHEDVFRPPEYAGLFAVLVGSGMQLLCIASVILVLAFLGFLCPQHRGMLLTSALCGYALMGSVAGFYGTKLYLTLGGQQWKRHAFAIALFYPGICFSVFFVINLFIWGEHSSGAVPFMYLVYMLLLWMGVSVPLVLIGSKYGSMGSPFKYPCASASVPKQQTKTPGLKMTAMKWMSGSLPFACMFMELNYLMKSLWHHTLFYYLFGFLLLCFLVLIVTSAEVSVLMTYISLCR